MALPTYLTRVARLPRVLAHIATYPDGVPLAEVARHFGIDAAELREDLIAFYVAVPADDYGLSRPFSIEFASADAGEADDGRGDALRADIVRVTGRHDLGVEVLGAGDLARLYAAVASLSQAEPDNAALASVRRHVADALAGAVSETGEGTALLPLLREAVEAHRPVRLTYSRAWYPGVIESEVHPLRLVHTHRGWELDAGIPADDRRFAPPGLRPTAEGVRTFLLDHVREAAVLDGGFTPPTDLEQRLRDHRRTTEVELRLPASARWAADAQAERMTVLDEDEESATVRLDLLEPVGRRIGLIMLAGGEDTQVPGAYVRAAVEVAQELYLHHSS